MDLLGILLILFVVFGAKVLPRIGETIGRRLAGGQRPPRESPTEESTDKPAGEKTP